MARKATGKGRAAGRKPRRKKTHLSRNVTRLAPALVAGKPGDVIANLVDANAQALGIALEPTWRDGVIFNLGLILRLGALVDQFPLADDTEPGPVFHA
jgi:hypothetical protein